MSEPSVRQFTAVAESVIVAAGLALFIAFVALRIRNHPVPYYDDVAYLDLANRVSDLGGPRKLVGALLAGTWPEDNRGPLYLAVLALVAGRDPDYHRRGQLVTAACGVLALLTCWWAARQHIGRRGAAVFVLLLSLSETLVEYSARESPEPLLIAFWALSTHCILRGRESGRWWLAAGVWAGIAQMDKGLGVLLVFCFLATVVADRGWQASLDPWVWSMPGGFALAAAPLLIRNLKVYGAPLHHWNNHFLWINRMADYAESYAPHALDRLPHGILDWLSHASARDLLVRVAMGAGETVVHLGDAMSLVAPNPLGTVHIPGVILGFAVAIAVIAWVTRHHSSWAQKFVGAEIACLISFSVFCFPAGGSSKYVFPLAVTLAALFAMFLVSSERALKVAMGWAMACALVAIVQTSQKQVVPESFERATQWLESHLRLGEAFAVDSRSHFEPIWRMSRDKRMVIVSSVWEQKPISAKEIVSWLNEQRVRFVVIDSASHKDAEPRYLFFDQMPLTPEHELTGSLPGGTKVVWTDPTRDLRILEVVADTDSLMPGPAGRVAP